jgi:hypothetical protein
MNRSWRKRAIDFQHGGAAGDESDPRRQMMADVSQVQRDRRVLPNRDAMERNIRRAIMAAER